MKPGGRIAGRVTAADSGAAVRNAQVSVVRLEEQRSGTFGRDAQDAVTDGAGRFAFEALSPGRYALHVERSGYARFPDPFDRQFNPIELSDAESSIVVEIRLTRGAVIAGRVIDEDGEPLADISVVAMRRVAERGLPDFVPFGRGGTSNDIGEFRIAGLAGGEYLVVASPMSARPFARVHAASVTVPTYYPNGDRETAQRFTLSPAQTASGVEIVMRSARAVRVSGIVVDGEGRPARAMVTLMPEGAAMLAAPPAMSRSNPDGSFQFTGVAAGRYQLRATRLAAGGDGLVGAASLFVSTDVEDIAGGDFFADTPASPPGTASVVVEDRDIAGLRVSVSDN